MMVRVIAAGRPGELLPFTYPLGWERTDVARAACRKVTELFHACRVIIGFGRSVARDARAGFRALKHTGLPTWRRSRDCPTGKRRAERRP
jgi:hypothetical protein